eukprot:Nitzschia sp. Nitz4//scaffold69_size99277//26606//27139//NITZ4_004625-RA/size99277-processed-gene-0.77-mRNA-1//-1//CDS//3329556691//7971//frame0
MPAVLKKQGSNFQVRFAPTSSKESLFNENDLDISEGSGDEKAVRFAPKVQIRRFTPVNRNTLHAQHIWYSSDELLDIKREIKFTVQCMSNENLQCFIVDDVNQLETHGLERQTRAARISRRLSQRSAVLAVLGEQEKQFRSGYRDEVAISRVYLRATLESIEEARGRAEEFTLNSSQ